MTVLHNWSFNILLMEMKMLQSLQKTDRQCLIEQSIHIPYNSANLILSINQEKQITFYPESTKLFILALFTMKKNWKQS